MSLRRAACTFVIAAALTAAGAAPATASVPRAQLTQFSCVHALDPPNRTVSIQAVMRPLAGTKRLFVKFDLLERIAGSAPQTVVRAGDLGIWISPADATLGQVPGDVWRVQKTVLNLDAPAGYQFRVSYRWTGAHGKVLGTATRWSRACKEKELRPDLLVKAVTVSTIAGHPGHNLYTADIVDRGATGAGPFQVLFAPGDSSAPIAKTITLLKAGATREVAFVGPACDPASPPTVTADATSQVDDYDRTNNALTAVCPAVGTS
jgi:hypothetical protein